MPGAVESRRVDLETGIVGTALFSLLLLAAGWRLAVHLRRKGPFTVFKRCHVVIVAYAALDIPRYVLTMATHKAVEFQAGILPRVVYSFHLVGTWLQVVALTMVILMWSNVFSGRSRGPEAISKLRRNRIITRSIFIVMNLVLLVATLVLVVRLCADDDHGLLNKALAQDPLYFAFVATSSTCLFVCAAGILAYGVKMRYKIAHHTWRAAALPTIQKLLRTLNTTMGVCTLMFALRIAMLLSLFDPNVRDNAELNELEWNILSYWIPTIVSATVLLYLMRGGANGGGRRRKYLIKGATGRRGKDVVGVGAGSPTSLSSAGSGARAVARVAARYSSERSGRIPRIFRSSERAGSHSNFSDEEEAPFASLPHGHSVTYNAIPTSPDHFYSAHHPQRNGHGVYDEPQYSDADLSDDQSSRV